MRILLTVFLFSIFGAVFLACDGGSGDGGSFAPTVISWQLLKDRVITS